MQEQVSLKLAPLLDFPITRQMLDETPTLRERQAVDKTLFFLAETPDSILLAYITQRFTQPEIFLAYRQ